MELVIWALTAYGRYAVTVLALGVLLTLAIWLAALFATWRNKPTQAGKPSRN